MRSVSFGWREIGIAVAVVTVNALLLVQLVGTPSGRPSAAFAQPYGDGFPCVTPGQCTSSFCVDGFCCNQICSEPGQSCGVPNLEGICVSSAQAPVLAVPFQWLAVGLVALISILRLRRRSH